MIPNPKKTLTIKSSISNVVEALNQLPQTLQKVNLGGYILESKQEMIDQWVFTKTEALSLGSRITVELQDKGNEQTEVTIEVSRVLGSFNQGYEVTNAMNHIKNVTNSILWYLNPETSQEQMDQEEKVNGQTNNLMVLVYIIGGLAMLGVIL